MKQPSDAQVSDSSLPNESVEQPVEGEDLEQEVEDLLADIVDLLVTHTEGSDSFRISHHADEKDSGLIWFVLTPFKGKAPGIVIGHRGQTATALRTLVKNLGFAHGRRFRLLVDTPLQKKT